MSDPAGDTLCATTPEICFTVDPGDLPSIPPSDQHAAGLICIAILIAALIGFLKD